MTKRMSYGLKRKTAAIIVIIIICIIATGLVLSRVQSQLTFQNYDTEIQESAAQLPTLLQQAEESTEQNTETYDAIYQSKAESLSFIANNNAGFEETDAKMGEYADLLEVDNVLLVRRSGEIVAKTHDTKANFAEKRFNQLRTVFDTGRPSDAMEIDLPSEDWDDRYYASRINDDTMIVLEQNPAELDTLLEGSGSLESTLSNVTVGQNGYVVAVSARDHLITFHPDSDVIGKDILDQGISVEDLENGNRFQYTNSEGTELYCGVSEIDNTYYIFAVPESDMANARTITVGFILFVCFGFMLAVALYGVFIMQEDRANGTHEDQSHFLGKLYFNRTIAKHTVALSVFSLIAILAVTFYMQTLFALSAQSVTNTEQLNQISKTIASNESREEKLRDEYKDYYLDKCRVAAYIVNANHDLAAKDKLYELQNILQIAAIYVFDGDGNMTASSTAQRIFELSNDESDSSYEFRKLLTGRADELVQDVSTDDVTGEARQYIGVTTHDAAGYANGLVQIAVRPIRLETFLDSVQIDKVLQNVHVGSTGFAFAVNKEDNTIAYAPNEKIIGKSAEEVGLTAKELTDGFSDYLSLNGETYYANCSETSKYYLYVAGSEGELMAERVPLTILTGISALICFVITLFILTLGFRRGAAEERAEIEAAAAEKAAKQAAERKAALEEAAAKHAAHQAATDAAEKAAREAEEAASANEAADAEGLEAEGLATDGLAASGLAAEGLAADGLTASSDSSASSDEPEEAPDEEQSSSEEVSKEEQDKAESAEEAGEESESSDKADESESAKEEDAQATEAETDKSAEEAGESKSETEDSAAKNDGDDATEDDDENADEDGSESSAKGNEDSDEPAKNAADASEIDDSEAKASEEAKDSEPENAAEAVEKAVEKLEGEAEANEEADLVKTDGKDEKASDNNASEDEEGSASEEAESKASDGKDADKAEAATTDEADNKAEDSDKDADTGEDDAEKATDTETASKDSAADGASTKADDPTLSKSEKTEAAAMATVVATTSPKEERNIDVITADGTRKRSESAVSRWLNSSFRWSERSPEQKLATIVKWLMGVLCFVVFCAIVFKDQFFTGGTVFTYILQGNWERGLNIFAITASFMYACAAVVVAAILQWILRLLSGVMGARGETICRLLSSVVKYGTIIFMLYWCLGVLGVDTATMLAGAGIITLAIGFGAQDLITDILDGLFIIFEGEFRVGDIIEVGKERGTVMEIGVRTTKIKDVKDNVLVIRNSNISNVTNMTRMNSSATIDIVLLLGESLPYVENTLNAAFPNVKRRVPAIIDGPFYKGVMDLNDTTMTIRVVATCNEADRIALERTLKREMALLLATADIAPFQVVYEHDEDDAQQTAKEKLEQSKADRFNLEQQVAAKDLGNEGSD